MGVGMNKPVILLKELQDCFGRYKIIVDKLIKSFKKDDQEWLSDSCYYVYKLHDNFIGDLTTAIRKEKDEKADTG